MASSKPEETTTSKAPMAHPKGSHSETDDLTPHTKKPCRSCVDFKTWVKQTNKSQAGAKAEPMPSTQNKVAEQAPAHSCPLDINQLGRNTWSFLHTMAANYPEQPSKEDETRVKTFMSTFSYLYPCEMCAYDFRKRMKKEPVKTDSQHNLSQWLCRMHNQINTMLGKKTFDCSKIDERWRDGWNDGSCGMDNINSSAPQSTLICNRSEAMDTTDGIATAPSESDNNNHKPSKLTNIYLENNLPVTTTDKGENSHSPPLTLNTDAKPRTKSLAETIETLKQNHPLTVNSAVSNLADQGGESVFTNRLSFTQHNGVKIATTVSENVENQPDDGTQMPCDIICNCDGNVFLTPSELSAKLLTPDGVLNEPSDTHCLPFPVSAKQVYYHRVGEHSDFDSFSVTENPETTPVPDEEPCLAACLPCRVKFVDTIKLLAHAHSTHSILTPHTSSNRSSAIIQERDGHSPIISFLTFTTKLTVDSLLVKAAELQPMVSASISQSISQQQVFPISQQRGITPIAGCEDHPEGGIECPKCDLILSSARSLGGHMTMMHSRNSCKTLKCPKCNWHYKYQETLEIHMKEKHPDTDQTCIYCVTKQSHPRLARGESYMCGYKPYRCEVCNYSTTTKGNLSIHMQSDKHINNIQELQQTAASTSSSLPQPSKQGNIENQGDKTVTSGGVGDRPSTTGSSSSTPPAVPSNSSNPAAVSTITSRQQIAVSAPKSQKWRCDVCNYETTIARNLRIHMTSEKHTHNMLILQQNVRSMQRNMNMTLSSVGMTPSPADAAALQQLQLGTMFPFDPLGVVGQMQVQSQQQGDGDRMHIGDEILPYKSKSSRDIYGCAICNNFTTDDMSELEAHLTIDRSATNNAEHVTITPENHYLCNLCEYKTPLKANFQLHCKTDRHMQRVQLVNHIREGGGENEWRMKYLNMPNLTHIVCNVCSYQSNSLQKMRIHSMPASHTIGSSLFRHLRRPDELSTKYHYCCGVCSETNTNKIHMVRHVLLTHPTQIEALCEGKWKEFDVKPGSPAPRDSGVDDEEVQENVTPVSESSNKDADLSSDAEKTCAHCSYTTHSDIVLRAHVVAKHSAVGGSNLQCPLCSDKLVNMDTLEKHLFTTHNVNDEGVKKLMSTVDTSCRRKPTRDEDVEETYRCQTCIKTFTDFDELCQHQNELGHLEMKSTPRGPGYLCWKKGCNQYFKSTVALHTHFKEIHLRPSSGSPTLPQPPVSSQIVGRPDQAEESAVMRCFVCPALFRTRTAASDLAKHLQTTHSGAMNEQQMAQYTKFITSHPMSNDGKPIQSTSDPDDQDGNFDLTLDEKSKISHTIESKSSSPVATPCLESGVTLTSPIIKKEVQKKDARPFKCAVCDVNFAASGQLDEHLRSTQHQTASAQLTRQLSQSHASSVEMVNPLLGTSMMMAPNPERAGTHAASAGDITLNDITASAERQKGSGGSVAVSSDNKYSAKPMSLPTSEQKSNDRVQEHDSVSLAANGSLSTPVASSVGKESPMITCQPCSSTFAAKDVLIQHQKLYCPALHSSRRSRNPRNRFKKLLNNYESEQQQRKDTRASSPNGCSDNESNITDEDEMESETKMAALENLLPPEMSSGKLTCSDCGQVFTGIWVLKTHKEEEHGQRLPQFITEHFGKLYKKDFDTKEEVMNAASPLAADIKNNIIESAANTSPAPTVPKSTQSAVVKTEPGTNATPIKAPSVPNMAGGALDLLNYPWLGMFPFGMLPPNAMFNPMMPHLPSSLPNKSQQSNNNSLSSPPLMTSPGMDSGAMMQRQHSVNMQSNSQQQMGGEKRARTRISDDQLKVLRQYFDINNSPSEQAINEMAMKTTLPSKVIKHWFRNTLFKERQRNKDSPYNFNNPPQTTLNLEEYEKTGRVPEKISPKFSSSSAVESTSRELSNSVSHIPDDVFSPIEDKSKLKSLTVNTQVQEPDSKSPVPEVPLTTQVKPEEEALPQTPVISKSDDRSVDSEPDSHNLTTYSVSNYGGSDDGDNPLMSPNSPQASINSDHNSNVFSKIFSSSSGSKRANRTRFSDYQVKTLNDYFEQNAYPKDEELELLSRRLQLPNRVIVVWFQNNRQKARKNYENSPSVTTETNTTVNPAPKSTSYPCKKCGVVFTGYYELVKHQKRVCMKNNIVPLPFGNQDGLSPTTPSKERNGKRYSLSDSSSAEKIADIAKQVSASKPGLLSPPLQSTSSMTEMTPTVPPPDLSTMMQYAAANPNFNLNSLFMNPFMPMPNMLGTPSAPSAVAPMQNMMKDFYDLRKLQDEAQRLNAAVPKPEPNSPDLRLPSAGEKRAAPQEYDRSMSSSNASSHKVIKQTSIDEPLPHKLSAASSQGDDEGNISLCGSDTGDDLESSTGSSRMRTLSGGQNNSPASGASSLHNSQQMKRFRTNLTNMQIHVMKHTFSDYKTPTMAECEMLGNFIGLQKRVVQVWFQNQRAKEKKHKQNNGLPTTDDEAHSTECLHCHVTYSHQLSIQEHLFTPRHINQIRQLFHGKLTEADRAAMRQQAEVRTPQPSRRVSSSLSKKSAEESSPSLFSPTQPSNVLAPGRANDYQAQLSRSLMSSLGAPVLPGLPGLLPGLPNPAEMLPLMYPGMLQSLSLLGTAGLLGGFPGDQSAAAAALGYSALDYGTPLNMLQIPQEAKDSISSKLSNPTSRVATYTQDCKSVDDIAKQVLDMDVSLARPEHTDVGYACRKCQLVFPRKESCVKHQATSICSLGKTGTDNDIVKIEQEQYHCQACAVNTATVLEYKQHCSGEPHKYNRNKYNNNNNTEPPSAKRLRAI